MYYENVRFRQAICRQCAALIALSACAEGVATSSNGMRFADGDPFVRADRASPEGTTLTLRAVKINMSGTGPYWPDEGTDFSSLTTKLVDATLVGTGSGSEIEDAEYVLNIDGDVIEFNSTDIADQLPVTSLLGDVYTFWMPEIIDGSLLVVSGYTSDTSAEWENVEIYSVIGLETDPGFLEGKAEATYQGMNYLWVVGDLVGDYACSTC